MSNRFASLVLATATLLAAGAAHAIPDQWVIRKTSWTETDERNYSAFIQALGASNCNTVDGCLKSPANPYRATDTVPYTYRADCSRFPYVLRAYFAWKNGLPFSMSAAVTPRDGLGSDIRYSPRGNIVTRRRDIVQASASRPLSGPEMMTFVYNVTGNGGTGFFRYDAETDNAAGMFYDFVPVSVNRTSIRPGTMVYDPNGHVIIVYKIENDGRVLFFDAHPDSTVTHGEFGTQFVRASPNSGSGFKNFRPLVLTGATRTANGAYIGGRVTTVPLTQVPEYSMEQFFGNRPSPDRRWTRASFVLPNGQAVGFYDWVRTRLAVGELRYHPVEEMQNLMLSICNDVRERVQAVDTAIAHGIQNRPQPANLPANIYGTSGDWEEYSSPSRDARLKTRFVELRTNVQRFVELQRAGSPRVVYTGTNLVADLRATYERNANACTLTYRRTDGSPVTLNFSQVAQRLFALSFDPYQCVELRWGASEQQELSTCPADSTKRAWYDAEQGLRNQIDRPYDQVMGFSLDQLRARVPGSGPATAPNVDVLGYLNSL